jgi:hypothetical protein
MSGLLTEQEIEALPIGGDVLTESDLVDGEGPDITLPDGVDQDWLLGRLFKDLIRGEHAKAVTAEAQMRRTIKFSQQFDHRFIEGLGQLVARVPLGVYLHWVGRYGTEFWQQPDIVDFFEKRADGGRGNPGFKIKTTPRATIVVEKPLLPATAATPACYGVTKEPAGTANTVPAAPVQGRRGRWART